MRKIAVIISILMFVAGLSVFLYPSVDNYIYDQSTARQQSQYLERIDNDPQLRTLLDDLYDELRRYNLELYENKQDTLVDAFSYSQPNLDLSSYGIEDNSIGFISIDKMDITLPIYLGANSANMKNGAVHLTETSFPIGGENTNAVIAAHRGTSKVMFRNIHKLEIGDSVIIKNFKETLTYQVCEIKIIYPTDVHELLIQDGRDLVTLITCHPLGKNYQRYVVYCERA